MLQLAVQVAVDRRQEMETNLNNPKLQEAASTLIDNLLASEAFVRYHQAQASLENDSQAYNLLGQLTQTQADIRIKQSNGGITQTDIEGLRSLQAQVQLNKIIMTYTQTQQEMINFLREVNAEINQLVGFDFAALANNATC